MLFGFYSEIKSDLSEADISDKLKSLLRIAGSVVKGGKHVTSQQVEKQNYLVQLTLKFMM
jgi:hypothetical protein